MKLVSVEKAVEEIRQAVDTTWLSQLSRKTSYMYGQDWHGAKSDSLSSSYWPYYPDIDIRSFKVGQGRDILNTAYLSLSRLMSVDPQPKYTGIDQITAEARTQFWLQRYQNGGPTGNGFLADMASCFMDFDNLGIGALFVGVEPGVEHEGGLATERTSARYIPLHDIVWDAARRDPYTARYSAHREFVPLDEAIRIYGSSVKSSKVVIGSVKPNQAISQFAKKMSHHTVDQPYEVVEVVNYWSVGNSDTLPTHRTIIGGVGSSYESIAIEHDLDLLPHVFLVNVLPPKASKPIGRVDMMAATQEQLNQLSVYIRNVLQRPPVDIIDVQSLDKDDVKQAFSGNPIAIKTTTPMSKDRMLWDRKPGAEAPATLFNFGSQLSRQLNEDSGMSEIDRGNSLESQRTLGEISQIQASSQLNRAFASRQVSVGFRRLMRVFEQVAKYWDTEYTVVDVFGTRVDINDPTNEASWTSQLYLEPAKITIDVQSLAPQDDQLKGAQRRSELRELAPYIGHLINPEWFAKEMLKTMGVTNTEEALAGVSLGSRGDSPDIDSILSGLQSNA